MSKFQFTHPRGVRLDIDGVNCNARAFQFTHPRGVRLTQVALFAQQPMFQFTHPRGVRHSAFLCTSVHNLFQFTHPRGVRLYFQDHSVISVLIQFTPPRGVRLLFGIMKGRDCPRFNSRPREGCDILALLSVCFWSVSIHAPARGATSPMRQASPPRRGFNSRTREGCDKQASMTAYSAKAFQFTHPRGVRLCNAAYQEALSKFQFTHPRGVRHLYHNHKH